MAGVGSSPVPLMQAYVYGWWQFLAMLETFDGPADD